MDYLNRLPRSMLIGAGIALVPLVGIVDYLTGWEFSLGSFYHLPICLVTLGAGKWPGLALSLASGLIWLGVELATNPHYTYPAAPYWNAGVRLASFVIFTLMMSSLREAWHHEKEVADVIRPLYHDLVSASRTETTPEL
jgi:hypothetical protein